MTSLVPINDTARVFTARRHELTEALIAAAQSGYWLNGPRTRAFADNFARFCGVRFCLPVANGTDALEIAFRALSTVNDRRDGEVITVANAGGYTTTVCRQLGLTPIYVDVEEASQLAQTDSILAALGAETQAIVVTHLYGGVVDVPSLRLAVDAAGFSHVRILEDCSQAHGGRQGTSRVGALGDIATFSFYPTKNLGALGDAGAIVTSNEALYEVCKSLHQYGWRQKYMTTLSGGRNSRMDELQAAALDVLLPDLETSNERRRRILSAYRQVTGWRMKFVCCAGDSVAHLAVAICEERDACRTFLAERQIATDIHYPVLDPDQAAWKQMPYRIGPSGLHNSRRSVSRLLTVPCFPLLSDEEVARICNALVEWEQLA